MSIATRCVLLLSAASAGLVPLPLFAQSAPRANGETPAAAEDATVAPAPEPAPLEPARPRAFAPYWATRPYLGVEIPSLALEPGARFQVAARYQSLLGTRLTIDGREQPLLLATEGEFEILREPQARDELLLLTVLAIRDRRGEIALEVETAERGPKAEQYYESLRRSFAGLGLEQRAAVCSWGAAEAGAVGTRGREDLLAVLEEMLGAELAGDGAAEARLLLWVARGESALHAEPRWRDQMLRFAELHGARPTLSRALSDAGYLRDHTGWRPKSEILAELGMTVRNRATMTRDRAQLEDAADAWRTAGHTDARLLRSLTAAQYQKHAKQQGVKEGMLRTELLLAWGYPGEVTWLRREERLFEGWVYDDHFVCLVDGYVFVVK